MRKLIILFLLVPVFSLAQKKLITLEDLYKTGTFRGEPVRASFDTIDVTAAIKPEDVKNEDGKPIGQIQDIIISSTVPGKYIIRTAIEPIYRRSSKGLAYVYELASKKTIPVDKEKILHPTFSPDGSKLAFVKDNNLYLKDLTTNTVKAVTADGKWNYIINGNCDWVYEEEFEFTQAYQWSPAGNYIAYYRFDETNVKEYSMTMYDDSHNKEYRYKYPKAGDDNSKVEIFIYNINTGQTVKAQYEQGDIYIPRIKWTKDDNTLCVFWMNRHQNQLKLLATNAQTGEANVMYEEKNKYYIEINDNLQFLNDKKHFVFTSEMNGYNHIYLYSLDGKEKKQISSGNYDMAEINGVDESNSRIYYTMAYPRPVDRNVFVSDYKTGKTFPLTEGNAWYRISFNDDYSKYFLFKSDLNTPQVVTQHSLVFDKKRNPASTLLKTINESAKLKAKMEEYAIGKAELIKVPNTKGDTLNGWMLKPMNFDATKKYPVLFCNYGGPGSQQVGNRFGAVSFWHQMLAEKGFIVVSVDNTGTGYRGEEFKKKTYLQLGKYEIEDQIDAAKYLAKLPYVDKNNIGHWGWSYGGFMSSLAITKGADVFTAAVAVAPVTSWRYYDNIYTERYMRTPQENPSGYDDNSPINHVKEIKGKYLLIHGTADDNVHFQNSVQMITALVKANVDFESAYYPNKNHGIGGMQDNTTFHLWSKMTNWILTNMGNENTKGPVGKTTVPKPF
ncbi:MAG: S9 family peptidase [Bacteroidetes bacterium]|nr:MAG: S9 family peptidase [Bacteroidota bacterium]